MKTFYVKEEAIVARKVGDELILVPIRQNVGDLQCIYTLNRVGSRVWELINGGRTLEDIVSVITQEYEVETPQAKADVTDFLIQMEEIGAIVKKPEGG